MSARWGVQKVRVSDLSRISLSRLEERVGWLGRQDEESPDGAWRDEPDVEEEER